MQGLGSRVHRGGLRAGSGGDPRRLRAQDWLKVRGPRLGPLIGMWAQHEDRLLGKAEYVGSRGCKAWPGNRRQPSLSLLPKVSDVELIQGSGDVGPGAQGGLR